MAVAAALKSGHVAGAAFDVFEVEPAKDNILFSFDNVIVTPHLGASTTEAQEKVALQIADQMTDYLMRAHNKCNQHGICISRGSTHS